MKNLAISRTWNSKWISREWGSNSPQKVPRPAPYFRKEFSYDGKAPVTAFLCGLGYYELYLNGQRVGDHVLDPVVSQYDLRSRYVRYDISTYLKKGGNTIGVILGDGWYNPATADSWHFDNAVWADYPKLLCELEENGKQILGTDSSWKVTEQGPITFNALRNGEFYDARRELGAWNENNYDDSAWKNAVVKPGPGGILVEQVCPPVRVVETLPMEELFRNEQRSIYQAGAAIAGWVAIRVKGIAGSVIRLRYSERVNYAHNGIDCSHIQKHIHSGEFQTDRYTLKGEGVESWMPRFTYHGFNYVEVVVEEGTAEVLAIEAKVVHSDFAEIGAFECSSADLNLLHAATLRSFVGNFVGIPTDCPHREKNGWTGDALIAVDTGLFHYDLIDSYASWLQSIADVQRPNGQLPGIIPSSGWGFNWGSGPLWDSVLIQIPFAIYRYTGDAGLLRDFYPCMKRYLAFLETLAENHLISFGLGDWCPPEGHGMPATCFTSTAYYYWDVVTMAEIAELVSAAADARDYRSLASAIRKSFLAEYYHGDGLFANGESTALAVALELNLCEAKERAATAKRLAERMMLVDGRADYGIIGAKYVPRALANNGYFSLAYKVLSQPRYPGWVHWMDCGARSLWESWEGVTSRNHIMFGDPAAWMMQFLAGFRPYEGKPGFREIVLRPEIPVELSFVKASMKVGRNKICVEWRRMDNEFHYSVRLPLGISGKVFLPDGTEASLQSGVNEFSCLLC